MCSVSITKRQKYDSFFEEQILEAVLNAFQRHSESFRGLKKTFWMFFRTISCSSSAGMERTQAAFCRMSPMGSRLSSVSKKSRSGGTIASASSA